MSDEEGQEAGRALTAVRAWVHSNGGRPANGVFVAAVSQLMCEWRRWTEDGMDIVATAILDEVAEIVKAMRDL